MATYHDLKAKISKLEEQARELLKKESAGVVAKIRVMMSEYGLTVQDLGLGITRMGERMSAMKQPLPPKYQDPVSGKTWSGKGKAPGWIADAIKNGKKDDFLIAKSAAKPGVKKSAPAKKAAPKKAVAAKPAARKITPVAKPAVTKKAPVAKKVAIAKKPSPLKPAAKAVAKPVVKKTVVTRKAAPKAKPAPKAEVTAPAATTTPLKT